MEGRRQKFTIICGSQGTGKSTFTHNILKPYSKHKPWLNVLPDDCEEIFDEYPECDIDELHTIKSGVYNLFVDEPDDFYKIKYDRKTNTGFKNGMVNIDDGRTFLSSRDKAFRKFISRRRQGNVDVNFNCHGLSEVPPSSSTFLTDIVLFGTGDEYERWTIDHKEKYRAIVDRINKISSTTNPYYYEHYKVKMGYLFNPKTGKLII